MRAGDQVEDYCRACKTDRMHTAIAVDARGRPIRVSCGFCRSEHNYRGGPRIAAPGAGATAHARIASHGLPPAPSPAARTPPATPPRGAWPLVSDRERSAPPVMIPGQSDTDLELLLRRVIREETGLTPVAPAEKWRDGTLVLRPGTPGLQDRSWPIETFFHKIVMIRNRLRSLEQQINTADLPEDVRIRLQGYISGCYGSLTSFNVLFADDADHFKGTGGD